MQPQLEDGHLLPVTGVFDLRGVSADYGNRFVFMTREDGGSNTFKQ